MYSQFRAHENDEQAQGDGIREEPLAASIASTKAAIESNAVGIEGTSLDMASLTCLIVLSDSEITNAVALRAKETKDSSASEAELLDVIDTLQRVIRILQEEMAKNPAYLQKMTDTHSR